MLRIFSKGTIFILALFLSHIVEAAQNKIHYKIDIDNPQHHRAQITILLPKVKSDHVDLAMSAWRTGKYKILPLADGVRNFIAKDSDGNQLKNKKIDRNTWRINLKKSGKVVVSYVLYANELGLRSRHIDDTHAYLDATATFMYSPEFINLPVDVELNVPRGWRTFTGLNKNQLSNTYVARDFHELADSPLETGINRAYKFKDGETQFEVVIWGKGNFDGVSLSKDLNKMVKTHKQYWGSYPFKRYVFIIHATDGARGATEHLNSTVIQRPRWSFNKNKGYLDFLSTASHEFVHTWNVKFYRPVGLVPYKYDQENYSKLLWFAEGGTSYLADKLLVKSGLMTQKEYFKRLAKVIDTYQRRPGRKVMSAAESSFDEWISSRNNRSYNDSVNIYSKGHMLSLWLDMLIIQSTDGEKSIRDLHRVLYQQFPHRLKGYSENDIIQILTSFGVKNASGLWRQYVDQTAELPLKELLSKLGLTFNYQSKNKNVKDTVAYLGMELSKQSTKIKYVLRNSPAWKAQINDGDFLVALNGFQVTFENYRKIVNSLEINKKISVSYFHNGILYQNSIKPKSRPYGKPHIKIQPHLSDIQKRNFKAWLDVDPVKPSKENKRD